MSRRPPCENPFCFLHTSNPNVIQENFMEFLDGAVAFAGFSCAMTEDFTPPPDAPGEAVEQFPLLDLDELLRRHARAA